MISLLTFNIGLLEFSIFGVHLFSLMKYANARKDVFLKEILKGDPKLSPDIIILQEVSGIFIDQIKESLFSLYPYSACSTGGSFMKGNLLTLSKFPLEKTEFIPFSDNAFQETLVMKKGFLKVLIKKETIPIMIYSTHLVAEENSFFGTGESIRHKQIEELRANVRELSDNILPIISGDFNTDIVCHANNFRELKEGYIDVFAYDEKIHGKDLIRVSWDPKNDMTQAYFRFYPAQRDDGFFIPKK